MEESINMEEENIFRRSNKLLTEEDIKMMGPLQLAYIGDACYELMVRTFLLNKDHSVNILHKNTIKYVKAGSQASIVRKLESVLTEKEKAVVRKGRNAKTHSNPKNAEFMDYKYATGFEALFGYLYLTKQDFRLEELFKFIVENMD